MLLSLTIPLSALTGLALALRPQEISICDYYTPIVTSKEISATSQYKLMLKITHTFILGAYTQPNVGVKVIGIAAPTSFQGHEVNLLPSSTGGYASTNPQIPTPAMELGWTGRSGARKLHQCSQHGVGNGQAKGDTDDQKGFLCCRCLRRGLTILNCP